MPAGTEIFCFLTTSSPSQMQKKICNPITNFRIMYPFSELHAINYILLRNCKDCMDAL